MVSLRHVPDDFQLTGPKCGVAEVLLQQLLGGGHLIHDAILHARMGLGTRQPYRLVVHRLGARKGVFSRRLESLD